MILNFEFDLDTVKSNHLAKHLGQSLGHYFGRELSSWLSWFYYQKYLQRLIL